MRYCFALTNYFAGDHHTSYGGKVIVVKCGEFTRRIGVDGTAEAIKEAVKCSFGLRTKRAFWLEDEDGVIRCLDRDMPLGTYILHLDDGMLANQDSTFLFIQKSIHFKITHLSSQSLFPLSMLHAYIDKCSLPSLVREKVF
jgi:hypothetical protein